MKILAIILLVVCAIVYACNDSVKVSQVVSVYDGDTIRVTIPNWPRLIGENIPVRIARIDTPELRGACEQEKDMALHAKHFTIAALSTARHIELTHLERDKYFRIVAEVYYDGKNLADDLLAAKLALPYDGGTKADWCTNEL